MKPADRLRVLVREIEDNLHRKQEAAASFARTEMGIELPDIGSLAFDATGAIRSIDLAPDVARAVTGERLGAMLVTAIRAAERVAAEYRQRRLAEAEKELPPAEWLVESMDF